MFNPEDESITDEDREKFIRETMARATFSLDQSWSNLVEMIDSSPPGFIDRLGEKLDPEKPMSSLKGLRRREALLTVILARVALLHAMDLNLKGIMESEDS